MKKSLLFAAALMATAAMHAQNTNYFDPADCDENGFLWFNTQEKIDKYIGWENTPILLQTTGYEPYDEPYASPTLKGAGYDLNIGGEGSYAGTIVLQGSDAQSNQNGGAIMMQLPSCYDFSVVLSSEARISPFVKAAAGKQESIDLALVRAYLAMAWGGLSGGSDGIMTWSHITDLSNGNTGNTCKSQEPVTVMLGNNHKYELYIHAIKVVLYDGTGGYDAISSAKADATDNTVYTLDGRRMAGQLQPGLYIQGGKKVVKK